MSATNDDGGAAFPCHGPNGAVFQYGMSLRDWFAGQALIGLLRDHPRDNPHLDSPNGRHQDAWIADNACGLADAMIAARKGGNQ